MFKTGKFNLHSGETSNWKLDLSLLPEGWEDEIAKIAIHNGLVFGFSKAIGIPSGGTKLAAAFNRYKQWGSKSVLIVDDVLTTGNSFREAYNSLAPYTKRHKTIKGFVVFARNIIPPDLEWVNPLFFYAPAAWKMELKALAHQYM